MGAELRRARVALGLSLAEAGKRAGVNLTHVSLIERGLRQPSLAVLVRLRQAVGLDSTFHAQAIEEPGAVHYVAADLDGANLFLRRQGVEELQHATGLSREEARRGLRLISALVSHASSERHTKVAAASKAVAVAPSPRSSKDAWQPALSTGHFAGTPNPGSRGNLAALRSPLFAGREHELHMLVNAVETGSGVIVIEGEAGVGKTRLVDELLGHPSLAGLQTLTGCCHAFREPFPLGPIIDALRRANSLPHVSAFSPLVGALRRLMPEMGDRLPPVPPLSGDPRTDRHLLFRAIVEFMHQLGPAVCVFEDLHWTDETTIDFLRFLDSQLPPRLIVVLTYRTGEAADGSLGRLANRAGRVRLEIPPLSVAEVAAMVGGILGAAQVSEEFASYVHERTGGLPLAVEEALRLAADRHDIVRLDNGEWMRRNVGAFDIPAAIRDSVLARFGQLRPEARRVVEAAAVLGRDSSEELLAESAALGGSTKVRAISQALEAAILVESEPGLYRLRHQLACRAVYEALEPAERSLLHDRAATALKNIQPRPLGLVAHHLFESGKRREWVQYSEAAADGARSMGDHVGAASFLAKALGMGDLPAPTKVRLAIKLGHAAWDGLAHVDDAISSLTAVAHGEIRARTPQRGEARFLLGILLKVRSESRASHEEWVSAVADLAGRPEMAVQVMLNLANPNLSCGTVEDHLGWLDRAATMSAAHGNETTELQVRVGRATTLLYMGNPKGWQAVDEIPWNSRGRQAKIALAWGLFELDAAGMGLGHWDRATEFLAEAERRAEELGQAPFAGCAESAKLLARWAEGNWEGLESAARRFADFFADIPVWRQVGELVAGSLSQARGDLDEAEACFRRCLASSAGAGNVQMLAAVAAKLAQVHLARNDLTAACDVAEAAMQAVVEKGIWAWACLIAPTDVEALLACGLTARAEALTDQFELGLTGLDAPSAEAALALCHGLVAEARGHRDAAVRSYTQAELINDNSHLPDPYGVAQLWARRGACLLANGNREGAESLLEALSGFEKLGARAAAASTRQLLRRHSVPVPRPRGAGASGYGEALSPRERQVADLVADGLSTSAIARRLFLSERTVGHHVVAAMHKLKVSSRVALASLLTAEKRPDG